MNFLEKLKTIVEKNNSLLCVGLDPDLSKLPDHLQKQDDKVLVFNKGIIDATHDLVCAYKIQVAFYAAFAKENELTASVNYIRERYPEVPIILDSKRGDIGNTATFYAKEAFERYKVDAVTVNPYMGFDSMQPFLEYKDKGIMILCRTSNPGAKDLQDLLVNGKPLYLYITEKVVGDWNVNGNALPIVGATYPKEIAQMRAIAGDIPFLVPGIGAQGGDIEATVRAGINPSGTGLIINSSRAILYVDKSINYASASRKSAQQTRDQINQFR